MSDVQNQTQESSVTDLELSKANEEIEFFGIALRPLFTTDVAYNAVRSVVMSKLYAQMDLQAEVESKAEAAEEKAKIEIAELYAQLEDRDVIITGLKQDNYELKLLAEDNGKKRDSAYAELLEAKQTIDTLNDKIASAAVTVPKSRTNIEGDNSIELFKLSLPAIYNVQNHPDDNRKFVAKLAATDESVEGLWLYKNGNYREVSPEEANTFRAEYEARQQAEADRAGVLEMEEQPVIADEPISYEVPSFRAEDGSVGRVDEDNAGGEVDGAPVTRAEFQNLIERVSAVELAVFIKEEAA